MAKVESQASLGPKLAALFFAAGMQFGILPGSHKVGPYDCYKWSYNYRAPYKWHCKWVTEVMTPLIGVRTVITPFVTSRGPPCKMIVP